MIDGTTPKSQREKLLDDFRAGVLQVIVNVNIFSEGFDCPDIEFIQLARPTKSLAMFLQQIGRGLRTSKDKDKGLILDNVGLYNRFAEIEKAGIGSVEIEDGTTTSSVMRQTLLLITTAQG